MIDISSAMKTARTIITANSPVLLLGTSIAGIAATAVLSAKAGYKARGVIDVATLLKGEELVFQEKVQLTWQLYTLPALSAGSAIASCVGVHYIHTKRANAMAALYAVTSGKLDDYTERAEKALGPKKTQTLNDELAQKAVDEHPPVDHEIIMTGNGKELCLDEFGHRYFDGDMNVIQQAVNEANRAIIEEGECSLNDFYEHLGLSPAPFAESLGWSLKPFSVSYGGAVSPSGGSVLVLRFQQPPKPNLGRP